MYPVAVSAGLKSHEEDRQVSCDEGPSNETAICKLRSRRNEDHMRSITKTMTISIVATKLIRNRDHLSATHTNFHFRSVFVLPNGLHNGSINSPKEPNSGALERSSTEGSTRDQENSFL